MSGSSRNNDEIEKAIIKHMEEGKPRLRNANDAIVFVLHLYMRELGFQCLSSSSDSSSEENYEKNVIPDSWNSSDDVYTLNYKHSQSASKTFTLKFLVVSNQLLVNGFTKEDKKISRVEFGTEEYVDEKADLTQYKTVIKDIGKLLTLFKIHIVAHIMPGLNKPGYEVSVEEPSTTSTSSQRQQQPQADNRPAPHPQYYPPPSFLPPDHDYDPLRIPGSGRHAGPFPVGYGDQFPPPLPGFAPPGGMGNLVGPNHPSFAGRYNDPNAGLPGGFRLPRGAVPPGARFDPFGPVGPGSGIGGGFNGPNFNQFGGFR
eukprot:TRINITY_DN1784_c0_g2_i1.p1 TRINITY_DN1784_c0_g2~~TRINITY_DN1784_c0_g2_i1.p1  ORF type:complete len:314 (-),score=87.70 TRINITY_DN1784_c0_g2_i1:177-1118(-)